jgi:hypothetical protein
MNKDKWLEAYRQNKGAIWIKCTLSNDEFLFFDQFNGWKTIKQKCEKENLFLKKLSLQFRSHEVDIDTDNCDGVYLIRSVMGQFGSDTKNYYTTGKVVGNKVYKKMWLIPELIVEKEIEDDIEDCFSEAIIYNETKTDREE